MQPIFLRTSISEIKSLLNYPERETILLGLDLAGKKSIMRISVENIFSSEEYKAFSRI